jgi:hypothetical protein
MPNETNAPRRGQFPKLSRNVQNRPELKAGPGDMAACHPRPRGVVAPTMSGRIVTTVSQRCRLKCKTARHWNPDSVGAAAWRRGSKPERRNRTTDEQAGALHGGDHPDDSIRPGLIPGLRSTCRCRRPRLDGAGPRRSASCDGVPLRPRASFRVRETIGPDSKLRDIANAVWRRADFRPAATLSHRQATRDPPAAQRGHPAPSGRSRSCGRGLPLHAIL